MENYSIDLISSLPTMGLKEWSDTLRMAGSFRPPHISVYDLQVEERTAFGRWYSPGMYVWMDVCSAMMIKHNSYDI